MISNNTKEYLKIIKNNICNLDNRYYFYAPALESGIKYNLYFNDYKHDFINYEVKYVNINYVHRKIQKNKYEKRFDLLLQDNAHDSLKICIAILNNHNYEDDDVNNYEIFTRSYPSTKYEKFFNSIVPQKINKQEDVCNHEYIQLFTSICCKHCGKEK